MKWRPRLATVLFAVNLLIFLLPVAGIGVLRLYESELIRRTETELNVQGALIASVYRTELLRSLDSPEHTHAHFPDRSNYGVVATAKPLRSSNPENPWTPIEASLDIAKDRVHPRAPDAAEPDVPPNRVAQQVGERIMPVLAGAHRTTLSGIRVTDFRGVVVASTRGDLGRSLLGREEVWKALTGKHVSLLRERVDEEAAAPVQSISRRSRVRVFVAMPVMEGDRVLGTVVLSRTPMDLSKALYQNRFYLIGGGAVIFLVMCAMTALTTLLVTRPVKDLIHQAEQVTGGERNAAAVPLERPGTYEVDRLSKALAEMSATLEKREEYVRTFASNVSHEFKTPLTSIRGTVELLKDHFTDMSTEDRQRFLDILENDSARLTLLVQRLLELARADVLKPTNDQTDLATVFEQVKARFRSEGLIVDAEVAPHTPRVAIAPEIMDSILTNLMENARQHGGSGVHVRLASAVSRIEGRDCVEIDVQDDGAGIVPSDAERIFTPFFTTARQQGGTGLGLAIVRALVLANHGTISLEPSQKGSHFRVVLPAAR
jgi:signal transduction histidine kinase